MVFNGTITEPNYLNQGSLQASSDGDVLKGGFERGLAQATAACDCTFSFDELVKTS
jgi:hypothetical protein